MKKLITFLLLLISIISVGQGTLVFGTSSVEAARVKLKGNPNNYTLTKVDTTFKIVGLTNTYDIKFGDGESITTRTLTLNAGTGVIVTGGTQTLEANRSWTISLPQSISTSSSPEFLGIKLTNGAGLGKVLMSSSTGVGSWNYLAKADVGLDSVQNISPANMPFSIPQQVAVNSKIAKLTIDNIASLKLTPGTYHGEKKGLLGYYTYADGGEGDFYFDSTSTATDNGGTVIQVTGVSTGRWIRIYKNEVNLKWFGAKDILTQDSTYNSTTALVNAIASLRKNPKTILTSIGGTSITAYSSGVVNIDAGVYRIDSLIITQDLGLIIRGKGSRRTNNSIRAASTLLLQGTNIGSGIRFQNNGARGGMIEDLDICYETSSFTGDVIDVLSSPGFTMNRAFIGTYGIQNGQRLRTARSLLRTSYNEYMSFRDCVFDGAVDGLWLDDTRTILSNAFGGSLTELSGCAFYDFTGTMIKGGGTKTKANLTLNNCGFNPISQTCLRAIDLDNLNGFSLNNSFFTPSTSHYASVEWIKLNNVTGTITNNNFNDFSKAGTLNGYLTLLGNTILCTDGFTLTGGIFTGGNNEFSKGTVGWRISPSLPLSFVLKPDIFKSPVTNSYLISADNVNLNGKIIYDGVQDASTGGFLNTSQRVIFENVSDGLSSISSTSYTVLIKNTGKTHTATGTATQTFTLPTPVPGTKFRFFKPSAQILTLNCAASSNFYLGGTAVVNTLSSPANSVGSWLEIESYGTAGWKVTNKVGTWN